LKTSLEGRVGLMGGAFDPIHNGHMAVARHAIGQFGLAKVILIPTGESPIADQKALSSREDRFAMAVEAVRDEPLLDVSRIEIDRPGPSYTIDTLRAMKDDWPEGICFIVGADRLSQIASWKEPESILALAPIIVAPRDGVPDELFRSEPFSEETIFLLNMPKVDLSSTFVRQCVIEGEAVTAWVPSAVAEYIAAHRLYRESRKTNAS